MKLDRVSRDLDAESLSGAYEESARYLNQNLDRIGCKGSHASRQGRRAENGYGSGEARQDGGQERWSRVSERARPTPSCSCLPPTACNFLAKALMRGLARHGRSPDRAREPAGLKSQRGPAVLPQVETPPCISLSPRGSRSLGPLRFRSLGPPNRLSTPSPRLSYFLSSSFICFFPGCTADEGGVFTSCAPRGSATVYLNSDLRSDTGLKLAKEVSRCQGISRILFLRGKPRHRGMFPKGKGHKRTGASRRFPFSSRFTRD